MSEKNPIRIEDLPETFEILPDDEIYIFQEKSGSFEKFDIPITILSMYFHGNNIADRLREKTAELTKLSGEFIKWINENYPTSSYIQKNYSTKNYFSDIYDPIANEIALDTYFSDYASKEYGQYKLAEAKASHEALRFENAMDSGTSIIKDIELENN